MGAGAISGSAELGVHSGVSPHDPARLVGPGGGCLSPVPLRETSVGLPRSMVASLAVWWPQGGWTFQMAVGFPRTNMRRDPGGNFWASYDLNLGSYKDSLLLNSTGQKMSQEASPDSRAGGYTRARVLGGVAHGGGYGGSSRQLLRLAAPLAIGLGANYLTSLCLSLLSYKMG